VLSPAMCHILGSRAVLSGATDRDITGTFGPGTGIKLFLADQTFVNYRISIQQVVQFSGQRVIIVHGKHIVNGLCLGRVGQPDEVDSSCNRRIKPVIVMVPISVTAFSCFMSHGTNVAPILVI